MARRLPVYLVIDTSGSMNGEPIESVKNGMQILISSLKQDPHALETAYLSVITFDSSARQVFPLTEITQLPKSLDLQASGGTALGEALALLSNRRDAEIVKTTPDQKGDYKPLVFIMTDGQPTDDWQKGLNIFKQRKWGMTICCAAGTQADTSVLQQISEVVVQLDTADQASFKAFFKWVSASITTTSRVVETGKETSSASKLPPPPKEITIVQ